jgi:Cu/Ag efflux pump CusA
LSNRYFCSGLVAGELAVWIGSLCYSIVSIICDFVDEYFGIDANLMSLGAIDFGIIIDGAVIIVEFIAFQIAIKRSPGSPSNAAGAMKNATAITGQPSCHGMI